MRVVADHYFRIGTMHESSGLPCQDYARSGVKGDYTYTLVADGCSSSRDTDIGSRILCILAERFIHHSVFMKKDVFNSFYEWTLELERDILQEARDLLMPLIPATACMDATLILAISSLSQQKTGIIIFGDGGFMLKSTGGDRRDFRTLHWHKNAPPYLSYKLGNGREMEYHRFVGPYPQGEWTQHISTVGPMIYECGLTPTVHEFTFDEVDEISIFTDGISSFDYRGNPLELAQRLTAHKSYNGEFVKRTSLANLKRLKAEGLFPADDYATATIRILNDDTGHNQEGAGTS